MWKILVYAFLFQRIETVFSSVRFIPVIRNVSLVMFNGNSTSINGTCRECLCDILSNTTSFSSFNCFSNNNLCQIFSQPLITGSFMLLNNETSSFYFFSWPIDQTTSMTNEMATATIESAVEYLWTFDSTYQDLSGIFNATPINGAGFSSVTITGYGSSLTIISASNQRVDMNSPFLNLSNHSWTFDVWIYLWTLSNSTDYCILSQCASTTNDKCFHLIIRFEKVYLGFFGDDLLAVTQLVPSTWYHIAVVFDSVTLNRSIYLNGVLDRSGTAGSVYLGNNGTLSVGGIIMNYSIASFNGLIDQLYYTNQTKSSAEILEDATLTLYFSFDSGSIYDSGPLRINGSRLGSTSVVAGRVGDALQFGASIYSYFRVSGLVLLGTSNQPYSMSIWIKPTIINTSSIIHVSSLSNGFGWCIVMLGMYSSGQLVAASYNGSSILITAMGPFLTRNNWIHAVSTYSAANGLRLYINGSFLNSSLPFAYAASGVHNYLFLASNVNGTGCGGPQGQFVGVLDEFRLYSRELSAADVWTLFNI